MIGHFMRLARADRLGPDVPWTHVLLHHPRTGRWICRRKFRTFGAGSAMRPFAYAVCTRHINIGRNVVIRPGCMLFAGEEAGGQITIEDDVIMGSGVHIYCDNHRFDDPGRPIGEQGFVPPRPVRVARGAWVGARAILLPGVTVGENAVVGAGSVVTSDVAPRTVAVGVPAAFVRTIGERTGP